MRTVVFYLCISLLLLCGGNNSYATVRHSEKNSSFVQNLDVKQQVKHKNSKHHETLKESSDIEVDEEFHTSDDYNDTISNKFLAEKQSLFLTFFRQNLFKDYSNNFKIFAPFSVHSNPIYLRIGVFRIWYLRYISYPRLDCMRLNKAVIFISSCWTVQVLPGNWCCFIFKGIPRFQALSFNIIFISWRK